ncbi:MAG: NADH-quinone oxidoreductase subunit J [Nitrospirae bacterium]|nr:NADH-quinone oxidoreductase subunit J [Nitrospirota bacterium]
MIPKLFFGYFSVVMIVLSLLIISRKNPIHSILWMLVMFFHIAGLYLFLNAEFLAAVQLILYAGAILVLFLFVIMMLNLKKEVFAERYAGEWPVAVFIGGTMLVLILLALTSLTQGPLGSFTIGVVQADTHARAIGRALYTQYLLPFEVASLILLVAVVGALVLAKKHLKSYK